MIIKFLCFYKILPFFFKNNTQLKNYFTCSFFFLINPYHAELYTQDITCMLNCFEEISQNLAFFLFLLCS